jgi:sugar phosphate isomerase/epimerase
MSIAGTSLAGAGNPFLFSEGKSVKRPVTAFTKCLQFLNMDETGEILARLGFDGADVPVRPGGHIELDNVKTDLPKAQKTLQKYGISIPLIVTAVSDADDPLSVITLKTAADAGIKYYRMGWLAYDFSKSIDQNLGIFKKSVEKLAKLNEKLGIHGGYQNHSGEHVGAPVWDLYELLKDVDPKFMGVQYDIRHAVTEGGYSWKLGMKRIAPWIKVIDIKDFIWAKNPKGDWKHQNVPLGEGMINFDGFLKEYKALNVEAPVSMHFEYDLGGAEGGKKVTSMPHEKIYEFLKNDLNWFRDKLLKNQIET